VIATAADVGLSDTSTVVVLPPPPKPDLDALPVAAGQVPNLTAYAALNVPSRPSGWSYADPTTGVRVWKVTTASVPVANVSGGHDYSEGGQEVSLPWGPGRDRYTIKVKAEGGGHWLVDFQLGVGLSNWRRPVVAPSTDLCWSFSNNPATPQVAYVKNGGTLYRINTATNARVDGNGFPHADTFAQSAWLSVDKNDAWFTWMSGTTSAVAWNAQTNVRRTYSDPGLNEIRLHPDGDWALLAMEPSSRSWNLATGAVSGPFTFRPVHNASLRGGIVVAMDVDAAIPPDAMRVQAGATPTATSIADGFAGYAYHGSGNWIQSDTELGGNLLRQWALFASYDTGPSWGGFPVTDPRHKLQNALGYIRADGSDMRLLAHSYSPWNGQYWEIPRAKPSPDGRLVLFDSNMQLSGRGDLFLVEVPAQ
jgi:hypothetical protein